MSTTYADLAMDTLHTASRRMRPLDDNIVRDLAVSIEREGLLHPIGVKAEEEGWRVIYGVHRVAAVRLLGWETIPAIVHPPDLSDAACLLMELQENLSRNDLTGVQRKAFAAEVGRLCSQFTENSHVTNGNERWLFDMGKSSSIPQNTLYNWWHAFCQESGLAMTPKQALAAHKEQFFTWLAAHQQREAEAKAAREAAAAQRKQDEDCRDALEYLTGLVEEHGPRLIYTRVIRPLLARHTDEVWRDVQEEPSHA